MLRGSGHGPSKLDIISQIMIGERRALLGDKYLSGCRWSAARAEMSEVSPARFVQLANET